VTRDGGIGVGGSLAAATESDDEASAIESEVSSTCSTFLFHPCCFPKGLDAVLKASTIVGYHNRVSSPTPRRSPSALTPFVCMMRSSNMEFFSPPGCYGANPSNPGHYYTRPHYARS
jgi:hypothetical protein